MKLKFNYARGLILIAQITDTHIVSKGSCWMGIKETQTAQRLQKVVDNINKLEIKPDIVVHTGDITDDGSINAYLHAKEILDKLTTKYFLVCGNHDNFDNLKQVFNNHNYFVDGEFAHYAIDDLSLRIIVIDTSVKGKDFGWLCDVRKKWLIDALRSSKKDTIIFLYHFPIIVKDTLFNEINCTSHDLI